MYRIGQAQKGKTNLLKVILNTALQKDIRYIGLFDSFERGLASFSEEEAVSYLDSKERIEEWLTEIEAELSSREVAYVNRSLNDTTGLQFTPILLVVDDYPRFLSTLDAKLQERIVNYMKHANYLGFNVIVTGN